MLRLDFDCSTSARHTVPSVQPVIDVQVGALEDLPLVTLRRLARRCSGIAIASVGRRRGSGGRAHRWKLFGQSFLKAIHAHAYRHVPFLLSAFRYIFWTYPL